MIHDGDIYIGVTVRPVCIAALKRYDAKRYRPLSFQSPEPGPANQKILFWDHCSETTELGLFWDMLMQLGNLLKSSEGAEILGKSAENIFVMGCSQSAMFLSSYFNVFHETDRPSPIVSPFDG